MKTDGIIQIHGKDYKTVAQRILEAHRELQAIVTEIVPFEGFVVVKAVVTLSNNRVFQGTSAVNLNANKLIEKENPFEVAETSAVGRALGFAGYGIVEGIASADEMVKATLSEKDKQDANEDFDIRDMRASYVPAPTQEHVNYDTEPSGPDQPKEDCPICHSDVWINEGVKNGKPWKNKKCKANKDHIVWWDFEYDGWRNL